MADAVLITGASAGIGLATARMLTQAGYGVINLDRSGSPDEKMQTHRVDLCDHAALVDVLHRVSSEHEIVGLINNAALARTATLEETGDALLASTFDLNLSVAAICARELVPAMKTRRYGRIINIASRSAQGRELRTAYAASKGGLISMTRVWALELAGNGITANCVAPGPIATDMFDEMNPNGSSRREKMVRDIPVGRMGKPEDVANAIRFFLSPESGYVNGQTLYVCGGLSAGVAAL